MKPTFAVRTHALLRRIPQALAIALDAATLASFPEAWLDALTRDFYRREKQFLDDEHNHAGLFPWERAAIDAFFPTNGTILVTSAGGGREALALLASGRRVVAADCVPELVDGLRRRTGGRAEIHPCAPDEVPPGRFDAAIVGWTAYGHLVGRARRVAFLRRLAQAVVPGGPILVSYWRAPERPRFARLMRAVSLARRPLGARPVEPGDTTGYGFFMHAFMPDEAPEEARAAGLVVVEERAGDFPHLIARTRAAP